MERSTSNDNESKGAPPALGDRGVMIFGSGGPVDPKFVAICRDATLEDAIMLVRVTLKADDCAEGPKVKDHLDTALSSLLDAQSVIGEAMS